MTIPRLEELSRYWSQNPPLHLMVKWYLGLDDRPPEPKQGDMGELMAMFSDGIVR